MSLQPSAVPFAGLESRVNRVALERTANARAVIGDGATVMAAGIFTRTPSVQDLGGVSGRARDITFTCLTERLAVPVDEGTPVQVYHGNQLVTPAGNYKVAPGGRLDHFEAGTTLLELELA
jgi:hypothetical protein